MVFKNGCTLSKEHYNLCIENIKKANLNIFTYAELSTYYDEGHFDTSIIPSTFHNAYVKTRYFNNGDILVSPKEHYELCVENIKSTGLKIHTVEEFKKLYDEGHFDTSITPKHFHNIFKSSDFYNLKDWQTISYKTQYVADGRTYYGYDAYLLKEFVNKDVDAYLTFSDAREAIRKLGFKKKTDWKKFRTSQLIQNLRIPKSPDTYYDEWVDWKDWFGYDYVFHNVLSKPEQLIFKFLSTNDIDFITQYKFDDNKFIKNKPFDFYLPNQNIVVEYNGTQHFMAVSGFHSTNLEVRQDRDKKKRAFLKSKNIHCIDISYVEYDSGNLLKCLYEQLKIYNIDFPNPDFLYYPKCKFIVPLKQYQINSGLKHFSKEDIYKIRTEYYADEVITQNVLAERYYSNRHTIGEIIRNEIYHDPDYTYLNKINLIALSKPKKPKADSAKLIAHNKKRTKAYYMVTSNLKKRKSLWKIESKIHKYINSKKPNQKILINKIILLNVKIKNLLDDKNSLAISKYMNSVESKIYDNNTFVVYANYKHYDFYDYSQAVYKSRHVKVKIICPIHGEFYQTPANHLSVAIPSKCPSCSNKNKGNYKHPTKKWRSIQHIALNIPLSDEKNVILNEVIKQKKEKESLYKIWNDQALINKKYKIKIIQLIRHRKELKSLAKKYYKKYREFCSTKTK